jgi:hypothetical protein
MNSSNSKSSRRAFFLQSAALGSGVAAAGASSPVDAKSLPVNDELKALQQQLALAEDREAIRQLHLAFTSQIENQAYETAAGKSVILRLRANHLQQKDSLVLTEDRLQATATWHVDVAMGAPLLGDSTVAQMARLQGQVADHRWEAGRLEVKYLKTQGQWKMMSVSHLAS